MNKNKDIKVACGVGPRVLVVFVAVKCSGRSVLLSLAVAKSVSIAIIHSCKLVSCRMIFFSAVIKLLKN